MVFFQETLAVFISQGEPKRSFGEPLFFWVLKRTSIIDIPSQPEQLGFQLIMLMTYVSETERLLISRFHLDICKSTAVRLISL